MESLDFGRVLRELNTPYVLFRVILTDLASRMHMTFTPTHSSTDSKISCTNAVPVKKT